MKFSKHILVVIGLLASSLLGGIIGNMLSPTQAKAAPSASISPSVKVTSIRVPKIVLDSFDTEYSVMPDIGNFTVENSASLIEATYQGRIKVSSFTPLVPAPSEYGAYFLLGIDNEPPLASPGLGLVHSTEATHYRPNVFTAYFQNLPAGNHTVRMFVRTTSGKGTYATLNPGDFDSSVVIIKEYMPKESLPYGSTYLPSIQR